MRVTGSFDRGLLLSVAFGQVAVLGDVLASAAINIATGATIILVAITVGCLLSLAVESR